MVGAATVGAGLDLAVGDATGALEEPVDLGPDGSVRPTLFNHTFERATDTIDRSARAGSPPASWPGLAALLLHRLPLALLMLKWVAQLLAKLHYSTGVDP